ncbi:MAG: hypothetical protein K0S39_4182 [Paenibacillus sp.]|jgi:hypothetical protein|nr:hypothetical protein [Paenibacillus sp.]
MKNKMKQAIIPALAFSLMFMAPAKAVEPTVPAGGQQQAHPNEFAFQIPMNTYCSASESQDFSFQLSNAAGTAADLTVYFYNLDGTAFNVEGSAYREIQSNIVPGTAFSLKGHATGAYHINFGNHKGCGERVYLGKIVVNSGQASLLASGWVETNDKLDSFSVNDNKKFDLAAAPAGKEASLP